MIPCPDLLITASRSTKGSSKASTLPACIAQALGYPLMSPTSHLSINGWTPQVPLLNRPYANSPFLILLRIYLPRHCKAILIFFSSVYSTGQTCSCPVEANGSCFSPSHQPLLVISRDINASSQWVLSVSRKRELTIK